MKKSILNLRGAQELSKNEQKSINGGKQACVKGMPNEGCPSTHCCAGNICKVYGQGPYCNPYLGGDGI